MSKPTVFVFGNGNIAVTGKDGEQIVELQTESVVQWMCKKLLNAGYSPTDFIFRLPNGEATPFMTENGNWNWRL